MLSNEKEQLNLFSPAIALEKRINEVLNMGTQESIVLADILNNGSTTVRDLLPRMNCPYGVIRDLQGMYNIPLTFEWETKKVRKMRKGVEKEVTEKYKRYFLAKFEG